MTVNEIEDALEEKKRRHAQRVEDLTRFLGRQEPLNGAEGPSWEERIADLSYLEAEIKTLQRLLEDLPLLQKLL